MQKSFSTVKAKLNEQEVAACREWVSIYEKMDVKSSEVTYIAGAVVQETSAVPSGLVERVIPASRAIHVTHQGSYQHLGNAWFTAFQTSQAKKLKALKKSPGFEIYTNDPNETPVDQLMTEVYVPVK